MNSIERILTLATPAFLGGADQSSEWRTCSLKGVLRTWWRVVYGRRINYDEAELREKEGQLWGHAWLEHRDRRGGPQKWFWQARLRVVLKPIEGDGRWQGQLRKEQWPQRTPKVEHPWVEPRRGMESGPHGGALIDPLLYLAYGPVTTRGLKTPPAMAPGQAARLRIAWRGSLSAEDREDLEATLEALHLFGGLGGRSRNGWGSVRLTSQPSEAASSRHDLEQCLGSFLQRYVQPLERCLQLDWCHAPSKVGEQPNVWRARSSTSSWQEALKTIAEAKIAIFENLGKVEDLQDISANKDIREDGRYAWVTTRHVINYPVTNHGVKAWGEIRRRRNRQTGEMEPLLAQTERLANQLCFKVHELAENGARRFLPIAFHLAHRVPAVLLEKLPEDQQEQVRDSEARVWQRVHELLNERWTALPA